MITVTDLIDRLTELRDQHGDLPVYCSMNGGEYTSYLEEIDLKDIRLDRKWVDIVDHENVILLDW